MPTFKLTGLQLINLFNLVLFAVDTEEGNRYNTHTVLLESDGKTLTAVATNGVKAVIFRLDEPTPKFSAMLHRKDVKLLLETCTKAVKSVSVTVVIKNKETKEISFKFGAKKRSKTVDYDHRFFAVEGLFPRWREVIPGRYGEKPTTLRCKAGHLENRLSLLVDDNVWTLDFNKQVLVKIPINLAEFKFKGEGISQIGFNVGYLAEWLQVLPENMPVEIRFYDQHTVIHAKAENGAEYLLMPVTI